MKKNDVVNLIRFHMDHNEAGFLQQARQIANDFQLSGDMALSRYVSALLTNANAVGNAFGANRFLFQGAPAPARRNRPGRWRASSRANYT